MTDDDRTPAPATPSIDTDVRVLPADPMFFAPPDRSPKRIGRMFVPTLLGVGLFVCIATLMFGNAGRTPPEVKSRPQRPPTTLAAFNGLDAPAKTLSTRYSDDDADMLADPPTSPAEFVDPDTLVVAHYEGDHDDDPWIAWPAFQAHLASKTGRKVELQEYLQTDEQVAAVAAGRLHIVAPHAADVPYLVNRAGFVPFAMLGTDEAPNGNHMVIAVMQKSAATSLHDVRGRMLACTQPNSITGYRAAISLLSDRAGLKPDNDYRVTYSAGQERSIRGLREGLYEVVAISHDKLQWMLKAGKINATEFRTIFESDVVPRRTVGHVHNLAPKLAEKVKQAVLSFENKFAPTEDRHQPHMRFFVVDYRRDFQFVRKMDNSFDPRFSQSLAAARTQ